MIKTVIIDIIIDKIKIKTVIMIKKTVINVKNLRSSGDATLLPSPAIFVVKFNKNPHKSSRENIKCKILNCDRK